MNKSNKQQNKVIEEFADAAVEMLRGSHHSELEPFEAYAARLKGEMVKHLADYRRRLSRGYQVLLDELSKEKAPPSSAGPSGMIRP